MYSRSVFLITSIIRRVFNVFSNTIITVLKVNLVLFIYDCDYEKKDFPYGKHKTRTKIKICSSIASVLNVTYKIPSCIKYELIAIIISDYTTLTWRYEIRESFNKLLTNGQQAKIYSKRRHLAV